MPASWAEGQELNTDEVVAVATLPRPHSGIALCQSDAPQGPGLLTQFCGQNGEVVPDPSLAVQAHCCADSAIFGLNGEATLWVRVGEDGVSRENGLIRELPPLPPSLLSRPFILLECPNVLSRAFPATQSHQSGKPCDLRDLDATGVVEGEALPVFQTCRLCSGKPGTCVSSLLCLRPPV